MTAAIYLSGAVAVCCVIWLFVASAGPGRGSCGPPWRRVWLAILAATASVATFLIIRFIAIETPVSASVVMRGWVGLPLVFAPVFTIVAALIMSAAGLVWRLREHVKQGPSVGRHASQAHPADGCKADSRSEAHRPQLMRKHVGRSRRRSVKRKPAWICILVGLALVPSLTACAHGGGSASASPDPFVGTWRTLHRGSSSTLIIAKTVNRYRATLLAGKPNSFSLVRHGEQLTGMVHLAAGPVAVELTYQPGRQHIAWRNGKESGSNPSAWSSAQQLGRISPATASPTKL